MQHTTGVAVLATHLAATDRRALSQAWYSALHLAGRPPRPRTSRAEDRTRDASSARRTHAPAPGNGRATHGDIGRAIRSRPSSAPVTRRDVAALAAERRFPAGELARRIERGLVRRVPRGVPSSFTIRAADGRVQLLVRSDGARVRVVAVCTNALRERVERALAQARFVLAASYVRAEAA